MREGPSFSLPFGFILVSFLAGFGISCAAGPLETTVAGPEAPSAAPPFPPTTLSRDFQSDAGVGPTIQPDAGAIENAAKVVASMRPGFRACFQTALSRYRGFSATIRLTLQIGADGSVVRVTGVGTNAPTDLIECLFDEVGRHRFDPPGGGAAIVNVPVNLVAR